MADTARISKSASNDLAGKKAKSVSAVSADNYEQSEKSSAIGASAVNRSTFSLGSGAAQTKVTVGQAGDRYEREADAVAENVMAGREVGTISRIPAGGLSAQTDLLQREENGEENAQTQEGEAQEKCAACDTEDKAQTATDDASRETPAQPEDATENDSSETAAQEKCAPCEREEEEHSPQSNPTAGGASHKHGETKHGLQNDVQTKVAVGRAGGSYESEADNVAERVSRGRDAGPISTLSGAGQSAQTKTIQHQEEDSGESGSATDDVQEKCAACESEDSAQTSPEAAGETTGDNTEDNGADGTEAEAGAQMLVQREAEEGEEEADETAEDAADEGPIGGEDDPDAADCGESGAGAATTGEETSEEGAGETEEESGEAETEEGGEEGGEAESSTGEGEGGGCGNEGGEEEEAAPEGGPTAEAHGEHSCGGGGTEDAGETAEAEAGPEEETGEEAAPPPLVPAAPPPCADQVAEAEDTSTEMADSGETEGEGAGGEHGGCGSAQTQVEGSESESPSQDVVQEQQDEGPDASQADEAAPEPGSEAAQETSEDGDETQAMTAQRQTGESDSEEGADDTSADTDTQAEAVQRESEDSVQEEEEDNAQMDGETDCAPAEAEAAAQTLVRTKPGADRRRDEKSAIAGDAIKNRGAGDALAPTVRGPLEKAMRVDLGEVRVHTGTQAETANKGLRSRAFTHKNHVWLAAGESQTDLRLMAHELTHSVQQGAIVQDEGGAGGKVESGNESAEAGEGKKTPDQPESGAQTMPENGASEEQDNPADTDGADSETGGLTNEPSDLADNAGKSTSGGTRELPADGTGSAAPDPARTGPGSSKGARQIGSMDNTDNTDNTENTKVPSGEASISKPVAVSEGHTNAPRNTADSREPARDQKARGDAAGEKAGAEQSGKETRTPTEKPPTDERTTEGKTSSPKQSVEANQPGEEEKEQNTGVAEPEKTPDDQKRAHDTHKGQREKPQEKPDTRVNLDTQVTPAVKPDIQVTPAEPAAALTSRGSVDLAQPSGEAAGKTASRSPEDISPPGAVSAAPAAKTAAPAGGEAGAATAQAGGRQTNSGGAQVPAFMSTPDSASGGRGASSVPVSLGGTDSAAGLMRQFSQISPLQAPFHVKALGRGMGELAKKRREQETQAPPTAEYRPRAPGLTGNAATAQIGDKQQPQNLDGLAGEQQTPPVETVKPHEHPRPVPAVGVSARDEQRVEDIPETDPAATQAAMHEWLNNFTGGLPSDGGVSTDPGPEPQITLPGRYNPNQIQTVSQRGGDQLRREQARRAEEPGQDFGENAVAPDAENETVKSRIRELQPRKGERCPQAEKIEPYRFDAEDEQDLAERTRPEFADDYDNEFTRIDNAETHRDATVRQVRADGMADVDAAHNAAYDEELIAVDEGRRRVDAQRVLWRAENEDVLLDYEDEARVHGTEVTGEITKHVAGEQQGINTQRAEVVRQAQNKEKETQAEKTRLENEAKEKEKAQRSRSTISRIGRWIKRKVVSIANWLSNKLKEAFNKLRAWVRDLFNRFKKWALEQIEKARRWVNEKLEDFRKWAHKAVDRYLGKYPSIARRFHRAIDNTVDGAKRAVNRAADALKKRVAQIIDFMADAVDKALAVVEGVLQTGLWFACNAAVTGINFAILLIDQDIDALIDFINEMPEPAVLGPIWPAIKYALLGFLVTLRDKPEEEKKRYARKTKWLVISPAYYLGVFVGVLKGFVWDGLVGLVVMLKDIIVGIPEAIKAMYDYFSRLINDVESIRAILAEAGAIWQQLKDFINDPDKKEKIVAFLQRVPSIVHEMVREAHRRVKGWAIGAGADAANALYSFVLNSSHYEIGEGVGRIVGRVLFEVALFFFTAGAGTAVKWGAKVLQVLSKAGRLLTSAARGGAIIMRALNSLRAIVMSGVRLAQRIGQGLRSIFVRLEGLVNRVFRWFARAFGRISKKVSPRLDRLRRRFTLSPAQRRRWYLFKLTLRRELAPFQRTGIGKARLRTLYRAVANRFRDVAKWPRRITKHGPHWLLKARKVKGLSHVVAKVLLDDRHRWRAGKKAVKRVLARLTDSELNTGAIRGRIAPLKPRYHYSQLEVVRDESEDDWDVWGAMSPRRKIAERDNTKGLKTGNSPAQAIPIHWYKNPNHYPNPIRLRINGNWTAVNMISNTSVTHRGQTHRVGIKSSNMVNVGTRLLRGSVHPRAGAQGRFRTLLSNLGYRYWANKDADHVTDIGFGGEDEFDNLWPLKLGVNRRAYDEKWYLKYRVRYKKSRTKADIKPLAKLNGKWFRIIGFNYRRPMPIGGREP